MARTLLITGASSGIGAATAREAVAQGWNVALVARSADKLETLAEELGDRALAIEGDVTDLAAVEDAVARTTAQFGGLDAAFANAGRGLKTAGTEKADPDDLRGLIELNILGLLHTARAALPPLRHRNAARPSALDDLLHINRTISDRAARRDAKTARLRQAAGTR